MSLPEVPYRDTIRLRVPESRRAEMTRGFVAQEIVGGILKMTNVEVLACQHFKQQGFFDLSFQTREFFLRAMDVFWENRRTPELRGVVLCASPLDFTVVVHVFNPYVEEGDICLFLRRYCETVKGGEKVMEDGLWTGRRRYRVRFKKAGGRPTYPPRVFALGPSKGRLFIPEIPEFQGCWSCGKRDHQSRECTVIKCFACGEEGHLVKDCKKPKLCSLCSSQEHLFRDCPGRSKTYAGVVEKESGATGGSGVSRVSPKTKGVDVLAGSKGTVAQESLPVAKAVSRPHGKEDGGKERGKMVEGSGGVVTPEGRQLDDFSDCSSSQEAEMIEVGAGAVKRPSQESEGMGTPVRRQRVGVGTANRFSVLQESEEAVGEEEAAVDALEESGGASCAPPVDLERDGEWGASPEPPGEERAEVLLPGFEDVLSEAAE